MAVDGQSRRVLTWEACYNARDLGGLSTPDRSSIPWRTLLRSDNLCRLTPLGIEALVQYGVRTIIDVRSPSELALEPHPFAHKFADEPMPTYYNLPLLDETDPKGEAALRTATSIPELYRAMIDHNQRAIAKIVQVIAQAEPGVLIHCHAGKDRTGIVIAVLLTLAGVDRAVIAEDFALSDTYLRPMYDEMLAGAVPGSAREQRLRAMLISEPQAMLATLDHIDRVYGGVEAFLRAGGLEDGAIEQIRRRLRA